MSQPGNAVVKESDEDFDNWIDHMHSFIHQILPLPPTPAMSVLTNAEAEDGSNFKKEEDSYKIIPCSEQAQLADARLNEVLKFHQMLLKPEGILDGEYEGFLKYCLLFFLDNDTLW
ncbi:hypothetical protein AcV7_001921 [Taiwanofungus camphoratus]|nr:hypothetical protein AcV7_001921 [Antrodia cinnamomea]